MRVVPPNNHLGPSSLLEHLYHLSLKDVIDGFDGDGCAGLGHGEDVDHLDRVLVHEFAEHEAHDFHRHACTAVLEHLSFGDFAVSCRVRVQVYGFGYAP